MLNISEVFDNIFYKKITLQSLKMLSITKDSKLNRRLSEKKNINNKAVKI